ncbi:MULTISPECIES: restriction endonuclease subunit S [unclassified Yoonia]|uniref:restriction endonuclease subunit S n=1 Tax=unclassified Yoonia TaxID=2629118 RepID=UPI002AFE2465|nr:MULTISPECIES: restriction endonuclease subunit S [unclassified Yoonia]
MSGHPTTWENVPISEIAEVNPRKNVELTGDDLVSFVPMASVDEVSGTIAAPIDRQYNEVSKGFTHFRDGDVIFAKITPSMENGKSAVARDLTNGTGMGSTEFHVLRANGAIKPEYLWHFIRQKTFRNDAQAVMSGAVGQQRVPADWLKRYQIPIAPLAEQGRIVLKVDGLTARTARARKDLSRIPTLIAQYKERILELAFFGDLTADWRKESGMHSLRTTSSNALWETPENWQWQRVDEVGDVELGRQRSPQNHEGPDMRPYIRSANITWEGIDTSDVKKMNFDAKEFERFRLEYGDVLLNEGSGSAKEVGKPVIWRDEIPNCCYQNTVLRVRPRHCSSKYLYWYLLLTALSERFVNSTKGVNIQHIGKAGLARYMIPVPSLEEQAEIVRRIESSIGSMDLIASNHAIAERLLPKLDAAILIKAFQGELVPQDPNDEPASAMLQRIKAERVATPNKNRGRSPGLIAPPREIKTMVKNLQEALAEAGGWISAQDAFQLCGIGPQASTEKIEALYSELRRLEKDGKLETEPVNDKQGRKLYDRLRLKAA